MSQEHSPATYGEQEKFKAWWNAQCVQDTKLEWAAWNGWLARSSVPSETPQSDACRAALANIMARIDVDEFIPTEYKEDAMKALASAPSATPCIAPAFYYDSVDSKAHKSLEDAKLSGCIESELQPLYASQVKPRTIETAPKDEDGVLAWSPSFYQGKGGWVAAVWIHGGWHSNPGGWAFEPTHWMPLPEKP